MADSLRARPAETIVGQVLPGPDAPRVGEAKHGLIDKGGKRPRLRSGSTGEGTAEFCFGQSRGLVSCGFMPRATSITPSFPRAQNVSLRLCHMPGRSEPSMLPTDRAARQRAMQSRGRWRTSAAPNRRVRDDVGKACLIAELLADGRQVTGPKGGVQPEEPVGLTTAVVGFHAGQART